MEYRKLEKSGLRVSVIGVGAEHLRKVPTEKVKGIFRLTLREGVNYFDLVYAFSNIIDGLRGALKEQDARLL
jgi:predicted aldo/keto reductase-like oxidoreductase